MCFAIGHGGRSTITASVALDREFVTGFVLLRHCKTILNSVCDLFMQDIGKLGQWFINNSPLFTSV